MSTTTIAQPAHLIGRTLIIQSSTDPRKSYTVTDRGCSCPSFKYRKSCKHEQVRADALAARKPQTDADYAKTVEACDELF